MAKVFKNQIIDFQKSLPARKKPKGIINSSLHKTANLSVNKTANKTVSSACEKPSGFFSPKNQVSFKGANSFLTNDKVHKFLKGMTNLGLWETIAVFAMSVTVKPLSLLAVPGAKKEDKKYAATKAILAGCVDFALTTTVLSRVSKVVKQTESKIKANPELLKQIAPNLLKNKNSKQIVDGAVFKRFKTVVTYLPKIVMIPLRAALTIALIPPTLKVLFPSEGEKLKPTKRQIRQYSARKNPINFSNNAYGSAKNTKLFKTFTGGYNEN